MTLIDQFDSSAALKERIAALFERERRGATCLSALKRCAEKGGTIFIAGDAASRFSADHLAEELQVRFRAGKSFGRADRGAVSAISLAPYGIESLAAIVSGCLRERDALIVFSAAASNRDSLVAVRDAARKIGAISIFVGAGAGLIPSTDENVLTIPIDCEEWGHLFSAQRCAVHAFCEPFEPEFIGGRDSQYFAEIFAASAKLDRTIARHEVFCAQARAAAAALKERVEGGAPLYCFGNGGSACDADELTNEFRRRALTGGAPLIASSFLQQGYLTCAVNDGFPLFKRGIEGVPEGRGVICAFSTSGQSVNITEAVILARQKKLLTVGFIGKSGGAMAAEVDYPLIIPSEVTERIQEAHTVLAFWMASQFSERKS